MVKREQEDVQRADGSRHVVEQASDVCSLVRSSSLIDG